MLELWIAIVDLTTGWWPRLNEWMLIHTTPLEGPIDYGWKPRRDPDPDEQQTEAEMETEKWLKKLDKEFPVKK